jgi:hypothetical protein
MTMTAEFENLPNLAGRYALPADAVANYRRDGHVLLRQVATADELAPYAAAITRCVEAANRATVPLEERDTYHQAFLQVANLWEQDAIAARFVTARRFARVAAELMGVDGVRLYHDQALFKEPGGGHTPWHQDQYYWPLDNPNCVTMWMPLVDVPAEMGVLTFAGGSHAGGELVKLAISDASEDAFEAIVGARGFPDHALGHAGGRRDLSCGLDPASCPGQPHREHAEDHDGDLHRRRDADHRAGQPASTG